MQHLLNWKRSSLQGWFLWAQGTMYYIGTMISHRNTNFGGYLDLWKALGVPAVVYVAKGIIELSITPCSKRDHSILNNSTRVGPLQPTVTIGSCHITTLYTVKKSASPMWCGLLSQFFDHLINIRFSQVLILCVVSSRRCVTSESWVQSTSSDNQHLFVQNLTMPLALPLWPSG